LLGLGVGLASPRALGLPPLRPFTSNELIAVSAPTPTRADHRDPESIAGTAIGLLRLPVEAALASELTNTKERSMKTQLDCPCGKHIVGSDEGDLVEQVKAHLSEQHPGHEYTREQILSMAY
jgi:hypothetical protein